MMAIFRSFLTQRVGRPMLAVETMNAAIQELERLIDLKPLATLADEWQVPAYILYDWRAGKTKCPTARYLSAIARGMGLGGVEELLALINTNGETPPQNALSAAHGGADAPHSQGPISETGPASPPEELETHPASR